MKKSGLLLLGIFLILAASCKKDTPYTPVPLVTVNIQINIDNSLYTDLHNSGGYVYLDGGARGIVVVHDYDRPHAYETAYPYSFYYRRYDCGNPYSPYYDTDFCD